jgi:hypothetical protein
MVAGSMRARSKLSSIISATLGAHAHVPDVAIPGLLDN